MGIAENKQVVLNFYDAGARGDMDTCFALLSDDVTWTNIGSTKFSGTYTGKQAIAEDLLGPLFGQLRAGISSQIERLTAEDDIVVAQKHLLSGHQDTKRADCSRQGIHGYGTDRLGFRCSLNSRYSIIDG
jgi:ketosteroid isomerase-like protein